MTDLDEPLDGPDEQALLEDQLSQSLGPELGAWAAEQDERIRELRREADAMEAEKDNAFAAARILMKPARASRT